MDSWRYGFGVAIFHRILLLIWMALSFQFFEQYVPYGNAYHAQEEHYLPALESRSEKLVFSVWRRWDVNHYLTLAVDGYRSDVPKPTIFPPLTPFGFWAFDQVLPGIIDLGAMVFSTLAFGLYLTFLYQFCQTYYEDKRLPLATIWLASFFPLAHYFSAPQSESLYMAMLMGCLYMAITKHWGWSAVFAFLATLARQQGLVLGGVVLLIYLEKEDARYGNRNWLNVIKALWPFALVPLAWFGFLWYRASIGLPPYFEVQEEIYNTKFTNPIAGLLFVVTALVTDPLEFITTPDLLAVPLIIAVLIASLRYREHRRLPLLVYTVGYLLIYLSIGIQIDEDKSIKPMIRHCLTLFPLSIFVVERWLMAPRWGRLLFVTVTLLLFLVFSAAHSLGVGYT